MSEQKYISRGRQPSWWPIATLVGILAAAPVAAFEVLPNKILTGGPASIRTNDRIAACGHAKENWGRMLQQRQDEVLRRYGLPAGKHPDYEIDHLIPLCLGGSDDPSNLWPQPKRRTKETWNAEEKQRLEDKVCKMVCDRKTDTDIAKAQEDFATDWIAAYKKYFGGPPSPPQEPPNSNCPIKGNVNDGKQLYHKPDDQHYDEVVMNNCNDRGVCDKGKRWFCSVEEAEKNGWTRAR